MRFEKSMATESTSCDSDHEDVIKQIFVPVLMKKTFKVAAAYNWTYAFWTRILD